ncbi:MAG: methyltransferase domain-containing protein [Betaproteobacteria bacterium]|nr:MAG: methyltransferase domain-containing protein [Betaproteobacteria bacterium]
MSGKVSFDSSDARRIERQYAAPAVVEQRRRTLAALALRPGETALDIGCGPGYLTREMAKQVGCNGRVIAIDTSEPMLDLARCRCAEFAQVEFSRADAAALPCEDASIDVAAAVQVYLFAADLDAVVREVARVLCPGGRVVIVDTDWDSTVWHSSDPTRMQRFLDVWMGRYANGRIARLFPGCLRRAGLRIEHADAIPIVELAPDDSRYSGSQVSELARFVTGKGGIGADEADAWARDLRDLAEQGAYFFALNRYLFVARKPG